MADQHSNLIIWSLGHLVIGGIRVGAANDQIAK
jgi:hypothetical protein